MSEEVPKTTTDGKGVDNLTEVLRLQAEALARISERMAGMPPHGPTAPLAALPPRLDAGGHADNLPVLAGDPTLSEESLPVLNAFRKFIDSERRRARIRLIWACVAFAVILAAVLGGILAIGRSRADQLRDEIASARQQADVVRSTADAGLRKAADAAILLKRDIDRGLRATQSNMVNQIVTRDGEIERLKETISSLEIENAMLTGKLKDIAERTEQLQGAYQAQAQQFQVLNDAMQAPPEDVRSMPVSADTNAAPAEPLAPATAPAAAPQMQFRLPALP